MRRLPKLDCITICVLRRGCRRMPIMMVLEDARSCIQRTSAYKDHEKRVSFAYMLIAGVLNRRGVYIEAFNNATESVALNPSSFAGYEEMAKAQIGLRRFEEAVNSAQQAIRLSDGKYGSMFFVIGSAYFELENWELARQSYEKAAESDPSDPSSDRKSTRLNSSHLVISYAVFCL